MGVPGASGSNIERQGGVSGSECSLRGHGGRTLFPLVARGSSLATARMGSVVAKQGRDEMIKAGGGRPEVSGEEKGMKTESRVDKRLRVEAEQVFAYIKERRSSL